MFAGFLSPKQDPRSLKVEAARVRTILSEKRIAEILYEAFDEILIEGIADARVLLVHVDEPGGHERAHVVGDRGGRQADALGQILPAERFVFDELDDIEPPLVGDRLQPVAEVL